VDRAEAVAPIQPLLNALSLAGAVALAGAIIVAAILARTVTRPLLALQRGVEDFGRGDFSRRIPAPSGDELGDLARAFNTMAAAIVAQEALLRESNRALEDKVAERTAALQASQAELLALFAAMQDVVLVFDREGRYVQSAPTGNLRLLGPLKDVEGKTLHGVLPEELANEALAHIRHALEGKVVTDFEFSLPIEDEQAYFSASISALDEANAIWVVRDVTARHETQQALARSEALNRAIIENSPVGISIRDPQLRLVYANEAWCRMKGLRDLEQALEDSLQDQRAPAQLLEYLGENSRAVQEIYERGGSVFIPEMDTRETAPGAARWASQYFYGILGETGAVESVVTLTQDITARKESEQEVAAILEFSTAMRKPLLRAETQAAIVDHAARIFATEAVGIAVREPGDPEVMRGEGRGAWSHWNSLEQSTSAGILADILRTGGVEVVDDLSADPRAIPSNMNGMRAGAAAALVTHDQVLGALAIGSLGPLPETKIRLLRAIAETAASALYRAILFEETERRLGWVLAIRSIDRAIMGSVDVRTTMNIMLEKAVSQLKMDAASILLLRGNRLEYAYGRGFKTPLITRTSLSMGRLQAGKAALENVPIFIGRYDHDEWECELIEEEGFNSYCVVPLISKGQVQGVLEVYAYRTLQQDPEWMDFLLALAGLAALSLDTATLVSTVQRTNDELSIAYDITLEGWSRSIDMRYDKVPGHAQRVVELTLQIARALGLDEQELVHVRRGAFLHDVGTIMVPEEILLKPGKLSPDEARILHQYPTYSHEMLRTIDFLRPALDIPYCHHEKWDGSGFPRGLRGTEIPFPARIFSVVEAWDALTHDRPYRKAWTRRKALSYIGAQSGIHYDPQVVRAFLDLINLRN
jgi:PAS domain S-box-containing protein